MGIGGRLCGYVIVGVVNNYFLYFSCCDVEWYWLCWYVWCGEYVVGAVLGRF